MTSSNARGEAAARVARQNDPATTALNDLPAGTCAIVTHIDESEHALLVRLKTMGLHQGCAVRVVRSGTRLIVQCGETRIGLTARLARHVLVDADPPR